MNSSRTLQISTSIAFEPIILLLGIKPKEVNKITGRLVNNKVHHKLYSRRSLNNFHQLLSFPFPMKDLLLKPRTWWASDGPAQFCSYHLCCMETKRQWLLLN